MSTAETIIMRDVFLSALGASEPTLHQQFGLGDKQTLARQWNNVQRFLSIASAADCKRNGEQAKLAEKIKKDAGRYDAYAGMATTCDRRDQDGWKYSLEARRLHDEIAADCYELCIAIYPTVPPPPFQTRFCKMLLASSEVTDEQIRPHPANKLDIAALTRQKNNIDRLVAVISSFDSQSLMYRDEKKVESQVWYIKDLGKSYRGAYRARVPAKSNIAEMCRSYWAIVSHGHDFCAIVLPHLVWDYDWKFGFKSKKDADH
jgi:hypothetical protein